MISSGPFDWLPGQTIRVLFALVFASPVGTPAQLAFVGDPPRPDPNDPALANFLATVAEARMFARSGYPVGIGSDGKSALPAFPKDFSLSQNRPNPFNPSTTIGYGIPAGSGSVPVQVSVYDLRGRLVRKLVERNSEPGRYQAHWNGRDERGEQVSSGIYIYRIEAGEYRATKKMVMVR